MLIDKAIIEGIEILPIPVFLKDLSGKIVYCNNALYEKFGSDIENIVSEERLGDGYEALSEKSNQSDRALLQGKGTQSYEGCLLDRDGYFSYWQIVKKLIMDEGANEAKAIVGVLIEITDRVYYEKKMKRINRIKDIAIQINQGLLQEEEGAKSTGWLLQKCIESIPDAKFGAILILDDDGYLRIPTQKGYPDERMNGFELKLEDSMVYKDIGRLPKEIYILRDIDKRMNVQSPELLVLDGESVKTSLVSSIWIDEEFYGFINIDSTERDVFDQDDMEIMEYMREQIQTVLSKQREYQNKLASMRTDGVTGLFNRKYLREMAQKVIGLSECSEQKLNLVLMDMDGMKKINDSYGHMAGDFVLRAFSERVSDMIRDCDLFGRFGGDEFIAIFPGSDKRQIKKKMEKVRETIESAGIKHESIDLPIEFSFGISEYPADGVTFEELVEIADFAMYEDKKMRKRESR